MNWKLTTESPPENVTLLLHMQNGEFRTANSDDCYSRRISTFYAGATHWSLITPPSDGAEKLGGSLDEFARFLKADHSECDHAIGRCDVPVVLQDVLQPAPDIESALAEALEKIECWFGEFPETGRFWDEPENKQPMSYAACYGSNGERDFMRGIARAALALRYPNGKCETCASALDCDKESKFCWNCGRVDHKPQEVPHAE